MESLLLSSLFWSGGSSSSDEAVIYGLFPMPLSEGLPGPAPGVLSGELPGSLFGSPEGATSGGAGSVLPSPVWPGQSSGGPTGAKSRHRVRAVPADGTMVLL